MKTMILYTGASVVVAVLFTPATGYGLWDWQWWLFCVPFGVLCGYVGGRELEGRHEH